MEKYYFHVVCLQPSSPAVLWMESPVDPPMDGPGFHQVAIVISEIMPIKYTKTNKLIAGALSTVIFASVPPLANSVTKDFNNTKSYFNQIHNVKV